MASRRGRKPRWVAEMQAVHWKKVRHAFGRAGDAPYWLESIAWGDSTGGLVALSDLNENLFHERIFTPALAHAAPFLVEALRATAWPPVRVGVLALLGAMAKEPPYRGDGKEWDSTYRDWGGRSYRDVFVVMWRGAKLYSQLLRDDADPDVPMEAAYVLGLLVGNGLANEVAEVRAGYKEVVKVLLGRARAEKDGLALSSVAFALGRVLAHDAGVRGALRRLFERKSAEEPVRVAAALALVEADGERHEEVAAVDLLIDTMRRARKTDTLFRPKNVKRDWCSWRPTYNLRRSPWLGVWPLRFRLCQALCDWSRGDEERFARVFSALLVGVRAANWATAGSVITPVLACLRPNCPRLPMGWQARQQILPPRVKAKDLTGFRRVVVKACVDNDKLWHMPSGGTAGCIDMVFMRFGLPTSRVGLRNLLGKQ